MCVCKHELAWARRVNQQLLRAVQFEALQTFLARAHACSPHHCGPNRGPKIRTTKPEFLILVAQGFFSCYKFYIGTLSLGVRTRVQIPFRQMDDSRGKTYVNERGSSLQFPKTDRLETQKLASGKEPMSEFRWQSSNEFCSLQAAPTHQIRDSILTESRSRHLSAVSDVDTLVFRICFSAFGVFSTGVYCQACRALRFKA